MDAISTVVFMMYQSQITKDNKKKVKYIVLLVYYKYSSISHILIIITLV